MSTFNITDIRKDFPVLNQSVHGKPLAYLDNAASSQKPQVVIDSMVDYYQKYHANIHRGVHDLSERATTAFEQARIKVKNYINATTTAECIFTRGTTEAVNIVASGFAQMLQPGDRILTTAMEHHSNLVPWQMACEKSGATLDIIPMTELGELNLTNLETLLTPTTKLVAVNHVSNSLGTINPIEIIITAAHAKNIPVLLDGAQAMPHLKVDVQKLYCEFYAFSGHKMYAPTGVGVLYGKQAWLEKLPVYQVGGGMIEEVYLTHSTYRQAPEKFEAGTPAIADVIGLGAAIDYLNQLDFTKLFAYEHELLQYLENELRKLPKLRLIGQSPTKISVVSFAIDGVHPHDVGTIVDQHGVAIRAGHHCTMPIMDFYDVPATIRASFGIYNTFEEADQLVVALKQVMKVFKL